MSDIKYYLGLDMGTSSVGWAVTDDQYRILRAKGKDLWGIREFEEANTSVERRTNRTSRRRYQRKKVRIGLLKDYFHNEIHKVDPEFYHRLDNSKYHLEDKDSEVRVKNVLFNDNGFTDADYYKKYPTIFHLRKELIESDEIRDIRLVFLAVLNMFKHRGHFLESSLGTESGGRDINIVYNDFCELAADILDLEFKIPENASQILDITGNRKISRSEKAKNLNPILGASSSGKKAKKSDSGVNDAKEKEKIMQSLIKGICGLNLKLQDIFKEEIDKDNKIELSFSSASYEEKRIEAIEAVGEDNYAIIDCMKEIYDMGILADLMGEYEYLSQSRVASYEKHHDDLVLLKKVIKRYGLNAEYNDFFRSETNGSYSAYVSSFNSGDKVRRNMSGRTFDDLKKTINSILKKCDADDADVQYIKSEIDNENFLPKQLTSSNGVIPNQVHAKELHKILENAEKNFTFLKETDETGLSVREKIEKLFSFQIPYYVGPVTEKSQLSGGTGWVVRKDSEGPVLPWNIDEKIDMNKTREEFISRLVRRCTYVSDERVLPKCSLEYEKYAVLNEINSIRVRGEKISVELKQAIFEDLFETGKRVSRKNIADYLIVNGVISKGEEDDITGVDIKLNNALTSYGRFKDVLGDAVKQDSTKKMIEKIIFWCTVYGDSKKILKEQITKEYGDILDDKQIKRILGYKFKDWGRLSHSFLNIPGVNPETGEIMPLISMMWETNNNLMELLNAKEFGFADELEKIQKKAAKTLTEFSAEDLEDMYFSAPVKRMIWQAVLVIKEIEKVLGCPPERLFIEMTRTNDAEKKRTDSRKKKFTELYKNVKDETRDWMKIIENADSDGTINSKKMYLYLTQKGRCMYTGNEIDLDKLFTNYYDIDHIYPRHFVKDDNISNNLVLVEKERNAQKSDSYPIEESVFNNQHAFWKSLLKQNLINEEKYKRLTCRQPFSDAQKADFIARQLVETGQGTKGVASILKNLLPDTELVYSKASNVSEFRQKFGLYKTRIVNDFHHAHDAYLNIVSGNIYYVKFTNNPRNFIKKEYNLDGKKYNYNLSRMYDRDVSRGSYTAWRVSSDNEEESTISIVRKMLSKNTPILTRMNFEGSGGIANQTLYSAKKAKPDAYIPFKETDEKLQDVTKYGGFTSVSTAYFFLVEHDLKKKRVRTIETLPITWKARVESNPEELERYCTEVLKLSNPSIRMRKIKIQSLIKLNGYYVHLSGRTGNQVILRNAVSMCLNQEWINYIKKIEKYTSNEEITSAKNIELYDILMNKHMIGIFSKKPNASYERLLKGREIFSNLSINEQCICILEIFKLTNIGTTVSDLSLIKGAAKSGIMLINKNISGCNEFLIINQSVTGLYSNTIDLLTI